jgi:hypothetical protein
MMAACKGPLWEASWVWKSSLCESDPIFGRWFSARIYSLSAAARLYFAPWIFDRYLDHAFAGVTDGKVVARAFCVPFAINTEGRTELPDHGWDQVIRWAHDDGMIGRARML